MCDCDILISMKKLKILFHPLVLSVSLFIILLIKTEASGNAWEGLFVLGFYGPIVLMVIFYYLLKWILTPIYHNQLTKTAHPKKYLALIILSIIGIPSILFYKAQYDVNYTHDPETHEGCEKIWDNLDIIGGSTKLKCYESYGYGGGMKLSYLVCKTIKKDVYRESCEYSVSKNLYYMYQQIMMAKTDNIECSEALRAESQIIFIQICNDYKNNKLTQKDLCNQLLSGSIQKVCLE